jgi:DNA replication and repair protein RecF
MILETFELRQFRCFQQLKLQLHPRCNVFVGGNGQGKTSILEALYVLSRGQSFRTHLNAPLMKFDCKEFALKAGSTHADDVFVHKTTKSWRKIELNQKPCQRWSELSKLLPCLVFHQDLFHIIDANAEIRRRLLDWGVFYFHPEYQAVWKDFKRVLLQRNALLKQGGRGQALTAWNQSFVTASVMIDDLRQNYFKQLSELFLQFLSDFPDLNCHLDYFNGWDKAKTGRSLLEVLQEQEYLDAQQMYTHAGPQRADILFLSSHGHGKFEWSRGQQKLILILLKLAQAQLLNQDCLFLMDDLAAELDDHHLQKIYHRMAQMSGQFFFTALDDWAKDQAFFQGSRWFYVNQGQLEQITDL